MAGHLHHTAPARAVLARCAIGLTIVLLAACGTRPSTAARISASAPAQLTNVADNDLCATSVTPTPAVVAERKVRGLGDCALYRKTYDEEYDIRGATAGTATPVIWMIMGAMAASDATIVSSPACPFNPAVISGPGALTYQRKPGCPRHTYDKP